MSEKHIVIVGAGLVGTLNAILLAKRNLTVSVYEKRRDLRREPPPSGRRTTNLALTSRGMAALKQVGVAEQIAPYQVAMFARMVHEVDGTMHPLYYGRKEQFILSTQRNKLNEILLNAAEKFPNLTCFFEHKLTSCNLKTGQLEFLHKGKKVHVQADVVFGNDGAHSTIRLEMMKCSLLDVQQIYVPYGYIELPVAKTKNNDFALDPQHLHLWPRDDFLMLCTANWDRTFNIALFMRFETFSSLKTEDEAVEFFEKHFPDALALVGEKKLRSSFPTWYPYPMVTIKCSPYHIEDKALIMGDAAHAMLPFLAQGVNSGFEDCMLLNSLLDIHKDNFAAAFSEYSRCRKADAHAVCDLTLYNFLEMRQLVNTKTFRLKKKLDNILHAILPNNWIPLYSMVAFTDIRYHICKQRKQYQDQILNCILVLGAALLFFLLITTVIWVYVSWDRHW